MVTSLGIITAICKELNELGFTHTPNLVPAHEFDLSEFEEQASDIPGLDTEYVYQVGPGVSGDDFHGTMAYPVDDHFFVISYGS